MNREEIIRTARGAGLLITTAYGDKPELARFFQAAYAAGAAAEREKVAQWMTRQGYATGHGDSTEDLLKELEWQIEERIRNEREVCAKVCEDIPLPKDSEALTHLPTIERCAAAIRARGNT